MVMLMQATKSKSTAIILPFILRRRCDTGKVRWIEDCLWVAGRRSFYRRVVERVFDGELLFKSAKRRRRSQFG